MAGVSNVISINFIAKLILESDAQIVHLTVGAGMEKSQLSPFFIETLASKIKEECFPFSKAVEHIHIDPIYQTWVARDCPNWTLIKEDDICRILENQPLKAKMTLIKRNYPLSLSPVEEQANFVASVVRFLFGGRMLFFGMHYTSFRIPPSIAQCWNEANKYLKTSIQHAHLSQNLRLFVQAGGGHWKFYYPGLPIDDKFDEFLYEAFFVRHYNKDLSPRTQLYHRFKIGHRNPSEKELQEFQQKNPYGVFDHLPHLVLKYPNKDWDYHNHYYAVTGDELSNSTRRESVLCFSYDSNKGTLISIFDKVVNPGEEKKQ